MKAKRFFSVVSLFLFLVIGVCVYFGFIHDPISTGVCSKLSEVPLFGSDLPKGELGQIEYIIDKRQRKLLARVKVDAEEFEDISSQMSLETIRYRQGFDGSDMLDVEEYFRPTGTRVWHAYGPISKNGRTTVRLYFEPDKTNDAVGILFIHIT